MKLNLSLCIMSPDIAVSEPIADMLLNAEESWLQRLTDPSAPLPPTDQRYDGGSHDLNTPVKNLWVNSFISTIFVLWPKNHVFFLFLSSSTLPQICFLSLHLLCLVQLLACHSGTPWVSLSLSGTVCWRSVPCSERQVEH